MSDNMVERCGAAMLIASRKLERDVRLNELTDDEVRMLVRAAIEALREPTEAMLDAAHEPVRKAFIEFRDANSVVSVRCSEPIWSAMIDTALKESNHG